MSVPDLLSKLRQASGDQPAAVRDEALTIMNEALGITHHDEYEHFQYELLFSAIHCEHTSVLEFFVRNGVNIDSPNRWGSTVLVDACTENQVEMFSKILELGANVHTRTKRQNTTVIFNAAGRNNVDFLQRLIAHGANINDTKHDGMSVLMWAIRLGKFETASALLQSGADVNATDGHGRTALFHACFCGALAITSALLERGADTSAITQQSLEAYGEPNPDSQSCLALIAAHEARKAAYEALSSLNLSHAGAAL